MIAVDPGATQQAVQVQREALRAEGAGRASRRTERETHRVWLRRARRSSLALVLVAAGIATVWALRPGPIPVDVVTVSRGRLAVAVEEEGMTRVKDRYVVSAPLAGTLARIALEPGDVVEAGEALGAIAPALSPLLDPRTRAEAAARLGTAQSARDRAQAELARARAAEQLAQHELSRMQALTADGLATALQLEQAEFTVRIRSEEVASAVFAGKVAEGEVGMARAALDGRDGSQRQLPLSVTAPVAGTVLRVHQESEGVVQAGAPLLEIGDPRALEVVVDLLTTDAVRVEPESRVEISGWGQDRLLYGRVTRIEPSAFTRPSALGVDEQRVNVIVRPEASPSDWTELRDGYRIEARFILWAGDDLVTVPHGAVFRHGAGFAVYRLEAGVARLTPVSVGHRGDTLAEISEGLQPGALVAVHPGDRVEDGARVEAR